MDREGLAVQKFWNAHITSSQDTLIRVKASYLKRPSALNCNI